MRSLVLLAILQCIALNAPPACAYRKLLKRTRYKEGEHISVYANKVGPLHNPRCAQQRNGAIRFCAKTKSTVLIACYLRGCSCVWYCKLHRVVSSMFCCLALETSYQLASPLTAKRTCTTISRCVDQTPCSTSQSLWERWWMATASSTPAMTYILGRMSPNNACARCSSRRMTWPSCAMYVVVVTMVYTTLMFEWAVGAVVCVISSSHRHHQKSEIRNQKSHTST